MPRHLDFPATPLAEEFDVAGDSDLPGLDQPITADDIESIVSSGRATEAEKREQLLLLRDDLAVRRGMDRSGDFDSLLAEIETAIASLSAPADGTGTPAAYGFDAADRPQQPDEILERREEESGESADDDSAGPRADRHIRE